MLFKTTVKTKDNELVKQIATIDNNYKHCGDIVTFHVVLEGIELRHPVEYVMRTILNDLPKEGFTMMLEVVDRSDTEIFLPWDSDHLICCTHVRYGHWMISFIGKEMITY